MKPVTRTVLAIAILLTLSAARAAAWGAEGHAIVAQIAMHYLSPAAKEAVLKILGKISPGDAGNWMDDAKSNTYYNYMRHWHYVDISKDSSYKPGEGDNLIAALNTSFNNLKSGKDKKAERKVDVLIIFHLIGDMHQPLHTGYPEDKGGNDVQVNYKSAGLNLHHVWDTEIIGINDITLDSCLALGRTYNAAQVAAIRAGTFLSWMYGSRSFLPQVYDFKGHKLDDAYMQKNKLLVEQQLLKGGIRLARVLETLFGDNTKAPSVQTEDTEASKS